MSGSAASKKPLGPGQGWRKKVYGVLTAGQPAYREEGTGENHQERQQGVAGRARDTEEDAESAVKMASDGDMPAWVKGLDFLTEPLEGNKANFILQNSQRLRTYFEGRAGKIGQLFSIYDRHPRDTALDPQSGVLYFIRTEEGLQDKAISLKSVASGPSKHTWKMAWGRKTHLKKWGVLYKSYRCRHMFQPKSSPPPYRMQIYMLQDHDRDAAKGEKPTDGLALVQILSLQDAPLRRRSGMKREADDMDGGEVEEDDDEVAAYGDAHMFSPGASSYVTPPVATAVATLASVPKTPGGGITAPSALSSINSKLATPASSLAPSMRSSSHSSITSFEHSEGLKGRLAGGGAGAMQVRGNGGASSSRMRTAAGRSVVQRLDMNLAPCAEMEDDDERSCGAFQGEDANSDMNSQQEICSVDGAAGGAAWGRDPVDSLELDEANPYQEQLVKGVKLNQQLSKASLPRHRNLLQQQYGAMAGAVLAEAVCGRPWGLPKIDAYSFGDKAWPTGGDVTALGWAQLISIYAAREREVARSAAAAAVAAVVDNAATMHSDAGPHNGRTLVSCDGASGARGGAVVMEAQAVAGASGNDRTVEGTKMPGEFSEDLAKSIAPGVAGGGGAGSDEQSQHGGRATFSHPHARAEL